ncbi:MULTISPECIES: L,D-transpeptidase family protein [unclassified Synechococcus]|uniref:L,D-transpeptidase family protein n=1 Tax=unclassified Synechococcus TaxID=2626047 RepID=UPI00287FF961|nr:MULTISPECIES: L,D-transpeptidase family protein [unclassified Synechococcus]
MPRLSTLWVAALIGASCGIPQLAIAGDWLGSSSVLRPSDPLISQPALLPPELTPGRNLVLLRGKRQLLVLENGRELRRFPVAVGMPGWETPVGQFAVIEKRAHPEWKHPATGVVVPAGPANPLGSRWIGFLLDCKGRSGFNGQQHLEVKGCVSSGFHGTPNRGSVGRAVSHGCVRLFEENVQELYELVQVGTLVTVLP